MKRYFVNGKMVGEAEGSVFTCRRDWRRHFMHVLNSWGINAELLQQMEKDGIKTYKILCDNSVYSLPIEKIFEKGFIKEYKGESQIFVKLDDWTDKPVGQLELFDV